MMRFLPYFLLLFSLANSQEWNQTPHCGFDFTSYLVVNAHENGKNEGIKGLKISLVDLEGNEIENNNNKYSWKDASKSLFFTQNYLIDQNNEKVTTVVDESKIKWYFPYSKDTYFLSIVNVFPVDEVKIKIQDVDGDENGGNFETQIIEINAFDLFVLCSNKIQNFTTQFGRKANKPIDVVLLKASK
jgi:hypothetical protein